jgi:hydroxyethylthiazole kinase
MARAEPCLNLIRIMPAEGWMGPQSDSHHSADMSAIEMIAAPVVASVRTKRPLIHNITNHVVMNFTANMLLAMGASPAMVHAPEEAAEFARLAGALVVNIGTLDAHFVAGMDAATEAAMLAGLPWVLDPVGVGATRYRNDVSARLVTRRPAIIRGNASEIMALAGLGGGGKGVDSTAGSDAALDAARALAGRSGAVVVVTGATDFVVSEAEVIGITGGNPLSQAVTGTGCATTAVIGACLAVAPARAAAIAGLFLMKRAAERASERSTQPGSFAVALIDAVHAISQHHAAAAGAAS